MSEIKIIGIDEVGRGALAGPVVVAAVAIPAGFKFKNGELKLRDSKKLTAEQRRRWFEYFKSHPQVEWAITRTYPRVIEEINISNAANKAASRAVLKILKNNKDILFKIFLDGGLYLSKKVIDKNVSKIFFCRTVVRGDEKITAIKIASIIAKVSRDRLMIRAAESFPQYGFESNKGYGTSEHFKAIRKYGPSCFHRVTFLN